MGLTPIYQLPYPAATDPADVPLDMQELAERIEAILPGLAGMTKIAELVGPSATLDFQNIPQTFKHLRLVAALRSDGAVWSASGFARVNNDAGNNYADQHIRGAGAAVTTIERIGVPGWQIYASGTSAALKALPLTLDLPNYSDTTYEQPMLVQGAFMTAAGTGGYTTWSGSGYWNQVAAITRLTLTMAPAGFVAGSRATLYGMS